MSKPVDFPVWLSGLPVKLQNTGPLIYVLLNHASANCVVLHWAIPENIHIVPRTASRNSKGKGGCFELEF